jgi:hypothetical protein
MSRARDLGNLPDGSGVLSLPGDTSVTGVLTASGGGALTGAWTIDNSVIGGVTPANATFVDLTVNGTPILPYNNVTSGLSATTLQSAVDEISVLVGGGNVGAQATYSSYEFAVTGAQTTFDLATTHTASYIPGYIQVFLNGVKLAAADYTAADGSNVVLSEAATNGDILTVDVLDSFSTATLLRVVVPEAGASDSVLAINASDVATFSGALNVTEATTLSGAVSIDGTALSGAELTINRGNASQAIVAITDESSGYHHALISKAGDSFGFGRSSSNVNAGYEVILDLALSTKAANFYGTLGVAGAVTLSAGLTAATVSEMVGLYVSDAVGNTRVLHSFSGGGYNVNNTDNSPLNFQTAGSNKFVVSNTGASVTGTFGVSDLSTFTVSGSRAVQIQHTTAASAGSQSLFINQLSTGDAKIGFELSGVEGWDIGIDNSDGNKFKLTNTTGVGDFTSKGIFITTAGNVEVQQTIYSGTSAASASDTTTAGWAIGVDGVTTINATAASTATYINKTSYTSGTTYHMDFRTNGTARGSIYYTSGDALIHFATSSDPRLKTEFREIVGAKDLIIQAHDEKIIGEFDWLENGVTLWGYNAHKLIDLQPTFGGGEGEGPRDAPLGGSVTAANADYSKRVPILEAALYEVIVETDERDTRISELKSKNEELENRLLALENLV